MKPETHMLRRGRLAPIACRLTTAAMLALALIVSALSMAPSVYAAAGNASGAAAFTAPTQAPPVPIFDTDVSTAGPYGPSTSAELIGYGPHNIMWDTTVAATYDKSGQQIIQVATPSYTTAWPDVKVTKTKADGELSAVVTYPTVKGMGRFILRFQRETALVNGQRVVYGQPVLHNIRWWPNTTVGTNVCVDNAEEFGLGASVTTSDGVLWTTYDPTGLEIDAGGGALMPITSGVNAYGHPYVDALALTRSGGYKVKLFFANGGTDVALAPGMRVTHSDIC